MSSPAPPPKRQHEARTLHRSLHAPSDARSVLLAAEGLEFLKLLHDALADTGVFRAIEGTTHQFAQVRDLLFYDDRIVSHRALLEWRGPRTTGRALHMWARTDTIACDLNDRLSSGFG